MKQFLGIVVCALALNSCDDGNLIVENIDFTDVPTQSCTTNDLLYKLNDQESLILNIPSTTFSNNPTDVGDPISLDINSTNQVVYTFYNGKVVTANICDVIKPPTPSVNSQWNATSGKIQITVTQQSTSDATNNSTTITGYNNNIVFKNITFDKGDGTTQFYETFSYGDYLVKAVPLPFAFNGILSKCDNSNEVYDFSPSESFTLIIDPLLIANEVTLPNKPRIGVIGATVNKLAYRLFTNGVVTKSYFCNATVPVLPSVSQEWLGKVGGTIEVTTTTLTANSFTHTIVLKNVTLLKGNSSFLLGDNYKYGELITIK
ncbi:hypothetical protein [Flavobacterium sp. N3904]|uniref:hypothetical protein n=1 Tax=Flavobacterium sp. N3904 TaxID=2986835 RepID=UPI0022250C79|nr:hypothetical protein [Flavobacterium sp. N3904]